MVETGFLSAVVFGPAREGQEIKIYIQTTLEHVPSLRLWWWWQWRHERRYGRDR